MIRRYSVTPTRRWPDTLPHTAASITNAPPRHPSAPAYAPTTKKSSHTRLSRVTTTAILPERSRSSTARMKHDPEISRPDDLYASAVTADDPVPYMVIAGQGKL